MYAFVDDPTAQTPRFVRVERPRPVPEPGDLLVRIRATAINPVDGMVRAGTHGGSTAPRPLGWDAAGEVLEVGPDVSGFAVGDRVFYAGALARDGSNAELQRVDARLVGHAPASLDFAQAAALPLTSLTAWESLFEMAHLKAGERVLVVNGAGGVGSIAIQLARRAGATVIATASRPATVAWVRELGAHGVVSHREPLGPQLAPWGAPDVIVCCHPIDAYLAPLTELAAPRARIVAMVPPSRPLDVAPMQAKALTLAWQSMFARSSFDLAPERQGQILDTIAGLVDRGELRTTLRETLPLSAEGLDRAHARIASGAVFGKLVLTASAAPG